MIPSCHLAKNQHWTHEFVVCKRKAFTLPELMVSIVILTLLVALLFGILNQVSKTWTQIRAQIDRHQNARSILGLIASDLRVAALPVDRTNPNTYELLVDPPALLGTVTSSLPGAGGTGYQNAHSIFWQAPIASDATTMGNMAEVGYFIRWDKTKPANPRAYLCRYFVNPSDTANYLINTTPTAWLNPGTGPGGLDTIAPGSASATPSLNYKGWFADNVIGMWVRCLDANGNPITCTGSAANQKTTNYSFDSRLGYQAKLLSGTTVLKSSYTDPGDSITRVTSALPSTIEIAIVVIDAQTSNYVTAVPNYAFKYTTSVGFGPSLASYANGDSPVNFWNDINYFLINLKTAQPRVWVGAHVYSIRVPLISGG